MTNGEFLAFVDEGGYRRRDLWDEDDWAWSREETAAHPRVWAKQDGRWLYRGLFDLLPLERVADWPVYVSLAEARAYARWRGLRLPTEAEFHRAAYGDPAGPSEHFRGGRALPASGTATSTSAAGRRRPWARSPRERARGASTSSWATAGSGPRPRSRAFRVSRRGSPAIPGYSADFFDGKHFVLKGASWATAAELVRRSFRNWFQAHYPFVFAKFRCVADA